MRLKEMAPGPLPYSNLYSLCMVVQKSCKLVSVTDDRDKI